MKAPGQMQWSDAVALSKDPAALDAFLKAQLVFITFKGDSTSMRAIETLLGMQFEDSSEDFGDIPPEKVYEIRERAIRFIQQAAGRSVDGEGSRPDTESGARED